MYNIQKISLSWYRDTDKNPILLPVFGGRRMRLVLRAGRFFVKRRMEWNSAAT